MYTTTPVNMEEVTERAPEVLTGCTSAHFHKSFMDFGPVFFLMFITGEVRIFSARRASMAERIGDKVFYYRWAFTEERYWLEEV